MTITNRGLRAAILPLLIGLVACGADAEVAADPDAPTTGALADATSTAAASTGDYPALMVYKTASCGCCNGWVEHLEHEEFEVDSRDVTDLATIKRDVGVPTQLASCHTALVDGYVIEGHVPAEAIRKLLDEHPEIAGLAVPGMPVGSPGMEGPNPQPYTVFAFDRAGNATPFMQIDPR